MGIEDLKRWHWIAIGLFIGLALGYVWSGVESTHGRTVGAMNFVADVRGVDRTHGPVARNIFVHPPQPNFEADAARRRVAQFEAQAREAEQAAKNPPRDSNKAEYVKQKQAEALAARATADEARKIESGKRIQIVTYRKLMMDPKSKKVTSVDRQFIADVPFVPPGERGTQVDPSFTVARYLDEMAKRYTHIKYSAGWWTARPAGYLFWTLGSLVAVGLLWPTLISALIGAGYGRPHAERPAYDLSRFKGTSHSTPAQPAKPRVTDADHQRLREMTEKLEANLAGSGAAASAGPHAPGAAAPVRKLDGGPLELSPEMKPQEEDDIELKGEYYPVIYHHKKQHDDEEKK